MTGRLPLLDLEHELAPALAGSRRLILSAPTGSGKSTQAPQMLLRSGLCGTGQIVILQPRRLAARLLAARVAAERGTTLGDEVGYQIRFENVTGPRTRIRFVTEGVLLRQMLRDPLLSEVSVLVFDEFHERHLDGDITLARALDLQEGPRPDLLLLVMSATLDVQGLETYLNPCALLHSEGRAFPVEIRHAAQPSYMNPAPVWDQAADAFASYIRSGGQGDVLVFMPGSYEINRTLDALRLRPESRGFLLLPLHGELPPRDQDAAVARQSQPKIVVSTNVAETSLTIDGLRCVIDSGQARIPRYDPNRGINTLTIDPISRAASDQRAGRAGRTAPGVCLRLWSQSEHAARPARELPEVKRLDLAEVVLSLKAAGVANLRAFRWLEAPDEAALARAESLLTDLGALKPEPAAAPADPPALSITPLGRRMLAFPLHPRYARMLLAAQDFGCVREAALAAALTQGRDLLSRNPSPEVIRYREELLGDNLPGDFWMLLRAWRHAARDNFHPETCRKLGLNAPAGRLVQPLLDHFLQIARREGLDVTPRDTPEESLQKCVLTGFPDHLARRLDTASLRCELTRGRRGLLARESAVRNSPLLVAAEVREVEGKDKSVAVLLSLATAVEPAWVCDLFPDQLESRTDCFFDETARRVYADETVSFRGLILYSKRVEPPPPGPAAHLLAAEVLAGRLELRGWDDSVDQWILRLNCLSRWRPELQLPPFTEADRPLLVEQLCHGFYSYKDIRDADVQAVVHSWLSPAQRDLLEKLAPARFRLPNGRTPKITYSSDAPPFIAARIADFYDLQETPRLAGNRVPVVLHILAPSNRPVQITQDLPGFWRDHYPRLKQELRRRYPKHVWR